MAKLFQQIAIRLDPEHYKIVAEARKKCKISYPKIMVAGAMAVLGALLQKERGENENISKK